MAPPLALLLAAAALAGEPAQRMYDLPGVGWGFAEPAGFELKSASHGMAQWERRFSRKAAARGGARGVEHLERIRARVRDKAASGGRWHTCGSDQVGRTVSGREKGRTYYAYACTRGESGWQSAPFQYYDLVLGSSGREFEVLQIIYEHHWRLDRAEGGDLQGWRLPDDERLPSRGLLRRMQKSVARRRVVSESADEDSAPPGGDSEDSAPVSLERKAPLLR